MHLARHHVRASSGSYRQFTTSNGPLLILPRSASNRLPPPLPSSRRRPLSPSGRGPTPPMFQRAANRYPAAPAAPLQSTLGARNNSSAAPLHKPAAPASSLGVKRKIEMTSTQSTLGSLHDEVYFDENDFDDDEDLDFEAPDPFTRPAAPVHAAAVATQIDRPPKITKGQKQEEEDGMAGYPNLSSAFADDKISVVDLTETPTRDTSSAAVKYPDLPPMPADDNQPPSSSIQYPWSSSPPSHFQAPVKKPRKLPWLGEEDEEVGMGPRKPVTPARPKQTAPWNKSASAIKEEQRELRRQNKEMKALVTGQLPPPRAQVASIFLSDEQRHVLDAVVQQGKSIFFTGSAGTGKSVLMREIIKKLRDKYKREPDRVAVTASTGLAACNIEGVTLHSFAGIGLGKEPVPELVKKIKKNQKARNRWLRTRVLIVDEVSMVDGDLFDKLEEVARLIRNNGRPFGGIQLVVTGDFFQLPPVPEGGNREAKFAFAASTWNTSIQHTILLTHIFRQKDPEFADMLNEMRLGKLTPRTIETFKQLSRPLNFHDALEATELFPTRQEVDHANSARMNRLSGEVMTFTAQDSGTIQDPQFREKLLSNCMAPPVIHLKKGAQVMLIKNMEDTLVNGSIGRVVAFMDEATFDYYIENENEFSGGNKPDGEGDNDIDNDDAAIMARARKKLKPLAHKDGGAAAAVTTRKWPLVCFVQPDGTERHLLCQPETWKIELPNGEVQAQRQQVPLILAWALSIHKAQGQTLQRVKVDLGKVFEKGQAYVALSRATSKAGLQVTRFDARRVMVHPRVIDFYSKLVSITDVLKPKAGRGAAAEPEDEFEEYYGSF